MPPMPDAVVEDAGCYLTLAVDGEVKISERGPKDKNDYWTSQTLAEGKQVTIRLSFDTGTLSLGLDTYHLENKETQRVFHADLDSRLDRDMIVKLRAFLDICLSNEALLTADDE
jgi:hypothetical protein